MYSYPSLTGLDFHCDRLMFTARETEKFLGNVSPFVTVGFASILSLGSSLSSFFTSRSQRKMILTYKVERPRSLGSPIAFLFA